MLTALLGVVLMFAHPFGVRLPDSREQTVMAPDLSNLPPGTEAVDPVTGEHL